MPDMQITIGGRSFMVACQDGEETYLRAASELLDREAQTILAGGARLTQDRMLLMAALMLADKSLSADEELRALDRRLAQQTKTIDEMRTQPAAEPVEIVKEVEVVQEVEVIPQDAIDRLDEMAARAEALGEGMKKAG